MRIFQRNISAIIRPTAAKTQPAVKNILNQRFLRLRPKKAFTPSKYKAQSTHITPAAIPANDHTVNSREAIGVNTAKINIPMHAAINLNFDNIIFVIILFKRFADMLTYQL